MHREEHAFALLYLQPPGKSGLSPKEYRMSRDLLNQNVDDSIRKTKFDDWMFVVTDQVLINRAKMSKFGLTIGEVTIVFQK